MFKISENYDSVFKLLRGEGRKYSVLGRSAELDAWKTVCPSVTAPGVKIVIFLAYSQQHRDDKVLSVTLEQSEPTGPLSPGLPASSPISVLC